MNDVAGRVASDSKPEAIIFIFYPVSVVLPALTIGAAKETRSDLDEQNERHWLMHSVLHVYTDQGL
jgi:hypothetical protein